MRRPSTPPPFCLCAPCAQPGVYTVRPTLRIVYPPLQRIGIVHAKLMLLQTRTFLRVVVSSANLTAEDWELMDQVWPSMFASRSSRQRLIGIGRCVESWQILFVQDFPKRSADAVGSSLDVPFAADLDAYLGALSAPDDIRGWLTMFDLRQARVRGRRCSNCRQGRWPTPAPPHCRTIDHSLLVNLLPGALGCVRAGNAPRRSCSVPGPVWTAAGDRARPGTAAARCAAATDVPALHCTSPESSGRLGRELSRAAQSVGMRTTAVASPRQTSSLGNLQLSWLHAFHACATPAADGRNGPPAKRRATGGGGDEADAKVLIGFPSTDRVQASILGADVRGSAHTRVQTTRMCRTAP